MNRFSLIVKNAVIREPPGGLNRLSHNAYHSGKIFSRQCIEIFFLVFLENKIDISCKLSPMETICMECQILFFEKKKKKKKRKKK